MQKFSVLIPYSVQITKIFCNLNTVKDKYGGFLHERLRAFKRLCNVNAALNLFLDWSVSNWVSMKKNEEAIPYSQ